MAIGNHEARKFIADLKPFRSYTDSLRGVLDSNLNEYRVYSYATLMAVVSLEGNAGGEITYLDERQYSVTTSKHQGIISSGIAGLPLAEGAIHYERARRKR